MLINREQSLLLLIDLQERLVPSITDIESLLTAVKNLIEAATLLGVPVCATEHCPASIGPTIAPLKDMLTDEQIIEKVHFSAALEDSLQKRLKGMKAPQIIICGTEAHVCVLQTAMTLCAQGFDTFVVSDASSSRRLSDREAAFSRARQTGVQLVTSEMVLFEWMKRADIPEFRDVLALVKSQSD